MEDHITGLDKIGSHVWPSADIKKTNSLFAADCRRLGHLFFYRALQMWSADCRCFVSEKTNSTLDDHE
ncbi:hypothetical protein LXL04_038904 [Taraxacum kok-saghyz]